MLLIRYLALSLLSLFTAVAAEGGLHIYSRDECAYLACSTLIGKQALYFSEEEEDFGYCDNNRQQAFGTMAYCLMTSPRSGALDYFINYCHDYGFDLTHSDLIKSAKNASVYATNTITDPDFSETALYYKPALLKPKKIASAYYSAWGRFGNYNYGTWFGVALIGYWFFVFLIAGLCNLTYFLFPSFVKSLNGRISKTFRAYISLPSFGRKTHAHHKSFLYAFEWLVPTRLESILVIAYWIMLLCFNVTVYSHQSPNLYWPKSKLAEMGRKIADRTGFMSMYMMPLLVLFAGRNNFLQWLTGWSYSRFMIFHRWIARSVTLLVLLHAVGMTYNAKGIGKGKYETRNAQPYVRWGYVSFVAMCLMCFHSLLWFRRHHYELFVLSHILLAVFFIVGGWIHVADDQLEQFFIACTAIWVFDRVVRIGRLLSFGVQEATLQLRANETIKVTIHRPAYWKPFPGCYAFIHILRPTHFWQAHPFTIVESAIENNTITFYLKVKGGITHGLYRFLSNQPNQTAKVKALVEGPYGQRSAVDRFDNTVFLAGGNGVPGLYYEAMDIAKRENNAHRVRFYWVIRHYRSIEWFYEELLKMKNVNIEPVIYVTQPDVGLIDPFFRDSESVSEEELEKREENKEDVLEIESQDYVQGLKDKLSFIEFREGRPELEALIDQEIKDADAPIAFVTCAHTSMVDDTRKYISQQVPGSKHRIELFEQIQGW